MGPLPQSPGPKPKVPKWVPPELEAPASTPAQEAPKKTKPASIGGFVENALDDAWDLAKGLYEIIPSTVKSYQKNLPYIFKNSDLLTPGLVAKAAKETAGQVADAISEPYKKHGVGVVYQRPVTVAGDLITILTLGGGSIKNAGKLAGGTLKGTGKASELVRAGKWLEELPSRVGREAIDSTVKTASGGKLDLAKRREFLRLKGEEQGRRIQRIEQDVEGVVKKIDALTPEEKELFHKARVFGDAEGYGVPDAALTPGAKAALDAYEKLVNKVDTALKEPGLTQFYQTRGLLDEATAKQTLAKKFALEAFDDVSPEAVAKAQALIDKAKAEGRRLPIYGQNVFVGKTGKGFSVDELADDLISGGVKKREGFVNSLEEMKGAKGYTRDPSVYVREMIKNFRNTEAKARLSERLMQEKALIKGSAEGLTPDSIPEGIHRKYYQDDIRAQMLKQVTDPTIKRLLKWEYVKNNHALVRLYDRLHGIFAKSATMFNPKWVTGNIVGDAVLGLLAGSDWVAGVKHLRRGNMPAQIAGKNVTLSTEDLLQNPGRLAKAVSYLPERAADVAGYVDQATRAGIISRKVARDLKEGALGFERSAETLEQVLRSTDNFSDVQVAMQLLEERVARQSPYVISKQKQIARLEKQESEIHNRLLALEARTSGRMGAVSEAQKAADIASDQAALRDLQRRSETLTRAEGALRKKLKDVARASEAERTKRLSGPVPIKKDFPERFDQRTATIKGQLQDIAELKQGLATLRSLYGGDIGRKVKKPAARHPDAPVGGYIEKGFRDAADELDSVRQKIVNAESKSRAMLRDITDDMAKRGDLEALVPGLREQVNIMRPAVERANAFVGDYLALDGFEQGVLRRLIPFYPWAKAMSMLAFRLPFLSPVKTFSWNRFSDMLSTLTQDPDLPDDFKGRVPVAVTKDGKTVWAKLTAYSPFESLKTSQVAGMPVPQMFNPAERNPFLGLAFQFVGGKTIWDASSIPYGEQMVSIGDGSVLRVKPNGKIEREIPQAPLVSGVMHMFPTTQLIQQVLQPYWTNKYDWAGFPEPILNADGSYKYPRELWDRLGAAVGLNIQTRGREDIIRSRKLKAIKNVKEMQSQYRRADPEEREFIKDAMQDYIQQEIRGGRP